MGLQSGHFDYDDYKVSYNSQIRRPFSFVCNTPNVSINSPTNTAKVDAFNEIYKVYYNNVIKTNNGNNDYSDEINSNYCLPKINTDTATSLCPANDTASGHTNYANPSNLFYLGGDATNAPKMKYKDLRPYLKDCADNLPNLKDISNTSGNAYYNKNIELTQTLPTNYASMVNTRKDLDAKMQEILATKGSIVNEQQNYIDGSVYTTLLWTVLATSLVFYTFTKI